MRWQRFAIASGILALLVLTGWWWQGQLRQREGWNLVQKALRFQKGWIVTGQARWSFRDMRGRWVQREGHVALAHQSLQVQSTGAELVCRLSGCQVIAKSPSPLRVVPVRAQPLAYGLDRWVLLRRSYRVRLEEPVEVAGRLGQWVRLVPRSSRAFVRRLAIEPQTGMVLAQEVLDRDGTVLSQWAWVKVSGKHPFSFRLPTLGQETEKLRKRISRWRMDGFVPVQWVTARCECCSCGMTMQVIHATDGLADVAIYLPTGAPQEHGCPYCRLPQGAPRATRLGAMTAIVISRPRPIVVVGDAPSETLLRLAQQIAHHGF